MKSAVRYFSKIGNTKKIAEAIAAGAGVEAVSVTDEPRLAEYAEVLFLGGAPYANIMAPELRQYAEGLTKEKVGRVVLFTTSNWSRRTVLALRKLLRKQGIDVDDDYFYAHMLHIDGRIAAARDFGASKANNPASERAGQK